MTRRHRALITADDIEDQTIATQDIASNAITTAKIAGSAITTNEIEDKSVQVSKFGARREHGTITDVTATGRYKNFGTTFTQNPTVVTTAINAENVQLQGTPALGSFPVQLGAAGTADAMYIAWGSR